MTHADVGTSPAAKPRILVVDDDVNVLSLLGALLGKHYDLRVARSGRDALRLARLEPPDLVLLDVEMPAMHGYEVCRRMKADALVADVPVVFLTAHTDEASEVRGLRAGAADFIVKPLRGAVVAARVANLVRLKQMTDRLRTEANTDGLTGLANRAYFDRTLHQEWLRAMRNGRPLALLMVDVDHFKAYNDHHGHLAGDGCLRMVAQALRGVLKRPADFAARYGGEEFVLLLPDTAAEGGAVVAAALRAAIAQARLPHPLTTLVTASVGVSAVDVASLFGAPWSVDSGFVPLAPEQSLGAEDLVRAADQALYAAKSHGRDQVWSLTLDQLAVGDAPRPLAADAALAGGRGG